MLATVGNTQVIAILFLNIQSYIHHPCVSFLAPEYPSMHTSQAPQCNTPLTKASVRSQLSTSLHFQFLILSHNNATVRFISYYHTHQAGSPLILGCTNQFIGIYAFIHQSLGVQRHKREKNTNIVTCLNQRYELNFSLIFFEIVITYLFLTDLIDDVALADEDMISTE